MVDSYIEQYYQAILKGEIVAGIKIKKQYEKLVHDIHNPAKFQVLQQNGEYKEVTYIFNEAKANEPIEFLETFCRQSKAPYAGKPLKLMLWQKALIQSVYGFVDAETGFRRYQQVMLEIGRKCGKSTLLAGLAAYHMSVDNGFEICCGANTRSQAEIIFQETKNILQQSKVLSKYVKKRKYDLFNLSQFNTMKPLANNSNLDGLNTDIFLCDEVHEFKDSVMFDLVQQSQGVKFEPLIFIVTTNGFVRDMFFDEKLDYANDVLNDIIADHTFLPILYELDSLYLYKDDSERLKKEAEKEIRDNRNWFKTLPALGEYRSYADVDKLLKETANNKIERAKLLAKYFNLPQLPFASWLTFEELINTETFDIEEFRGQYFLGGFDLSEVGDLTCGTLFFMKKGSPKIYIHQMYFMPGELVAQKEKDDGVPYSKWINQGWIRTSQGFKVDVQDVFDWFVETVREYNLYPQWQGFDRWGSAEFVKKMKAEVELETVIQGAKTFSAPMKELKAEFQAHNVVYNNNPVLKWCLANTKIETDKNGNIRPIKGKNKRKRIDGMVSLLDAFVVYYNHKEEFENML